MEENNKNKTKKIIIGCLFILGIILILIGFFVYKMTYVEPNGEDLIDDSTEDLLYKLDVYKSDYGNLCLEKGDSCQEIAFTIPTKVSNAKLITYDKDYLFVLYEDNNKLKIYNVITNTSQGILLENNYKNYKLYTNNNKEYLAGIVYTTNDDKEGYYNVASGNKLYEGKYSNLSLIDDNYLSANLDEGVYLLSSKTENVDFSYKESPKENERYTFSSYQYNEKYFFILNLCYQDSCSIKKIYSNNKETIIDKNIEEGKYSFNNDNLYVVSSNQVKKYDTNNKLISTSNTYDNIKVLINNYVLYVSNNKLIISNIDTEEIKELGVWNDSYTIDLLLSGYYTREMLDKMDELAKLEGFYIVINYKEKDKNGNSGIEYCYTTDKEVKTYNIK